MILQNTEKLLYYNHFQNTNYINDINLRRISLFLQIEFMKTYTN